MSVDARTTWLLDEHKRHPFPPVNHTLFYSTHSHTLFNPSRHFLSHPIRCILVICPLSIIMLTPRPLHCPLSPARYRGELVDSRFFAPDRCQPKQFSAEFRALLADSLQSLRIPWGAGPRTRAMDKVICACLSTDQKVRHTSCLECSRREGLSVTPDPVEYLREPVGS